MYTCPNSVMLKRLNRYGILLLMIMASFARGPLRNTLLSNRRKKTKLHKTIITFAPLIQQDTCICFFESRINPQVVQTRDSIFLTAFSIAGIFFLNVDHCSSVKLIPAYTNKILYIHFWLLKHIVSCKLLSPHFQSKT